MIIPEDINWLTTKVITHYLPRVVFFDLNHGEEDSYLAPNSFILLGENLPEDLQTMDYSSIEVYQNFIEFPPKIIEKLMNQVVPGGKIILHDTLEIRNHLLKINPDVIKNIFTIDIIEDKIIKVSKLFESIHRSAEAIYDRLKEGTSDKVTENFSSLTKIIIMTKTNKIATSNNSFNLIWKDSNSEEIESISGSEDHDDHSDDDTDDDTEQVSNGKKNDLDDAGEEKVSHGKQRDNKLDDDEDVDETILDADESKKKRKMAESKEPPHVIEKKRKTNTKVIQQQSKKVKTVIDLTIDDSVDMIQQWNHLAKRKKLEGFQLVEMIVQDPNKAEITTIRFNQPSQFTNIDIKYYYEKFSVKHKYHQNFFHENHDPKIYLINDFLEDDELTWLLQLAETNKKQFKSSYTNDDEGNAIISSERTSTFFEVQGEDSHIDGIKTKVADLMGIYHTFLLYHL